MNVIHKFMLYADVDLLGEHTSIVRTTQNLLDARNE
jgi:hypothetical protein